MPSYFDASDNTHLALLPRSMRDHDDLAGIAVRAEAAVITHFTRPAYHCEAIALDLGLATERYVYLRGFAADPANAVPSLVTALRTAIANVIRWTVKRDGKPANVESESGEKKSVTYRGDAEGQLPPMGWDAALVPFRISTAPIYL